MNASRHGASGRVYEHIEAAEIPDYLLNTFTAGRRISDICFE
jgi:hypothetical protein